MSNEKKWSADIETKWHAPEGFFEQSSQKIAEGLKESAHDHAQAMERLNFYINRAGSNITEETQQKLEQAKAILKRLYED